MKKEIKNWLFRRAIKRIAKGIVNSETRLTPEYLMLKGFQKETDEVRKKTFWREPNLKGRDTVWVDFEGHYYRVWHGPEKTFIACESTQEWFDVHYLMVHPDNGRYQLAGV